MGLIDLHCDTIGRILEDGGQLRENSYQVDIKKMKEAGMTAQVFACFLHMGTFLGASRYEQAFEYALRMISQVKKQVWQYSDEIAMAYTYEELRRNEEDGKLSAFLSVEEGGILNGQLKRLHMLYDSGVRIMTLTWNYENCIGCPASKKEQVMHAGLTEFGIRTVTEMNRLGMLIDVSHLSDGGFWDVYRYSKKPFAATHSNARALCPHPRNAGDEMLRALGERGGVAGLNLYPQFLCDVNSTKQEELLEWMSAHIRHMMQVGGEDLPAIGADFDGFSTTDEMPILHCGKMGRLWNQLRKDGLSERQIEKVWEKNARRILQIA